MRVNTKDLRDAVSVLSTVTGRCPVPIFDCIAIDYQGALTTTLRATDLTVETCAELSAKDSPFQGAIDIKELKAALKGASNSSDTTITADESGSHATIAVQGGTSAKVILTPISDFPATLYSEPVTWTHAFDLHKKIEWVSRAMSDDSGKTHLSCLFCEQGALVATDGIRLHHVLLEDRDISFHVPQRAVLALIKVLKTVKKCASIRFGTFEGCHAFDIITPDLPFYTVITKVAEGRFPPYKNVIPKHYGDTKVTFDATKQNLAILKSMAKFGCTRITKDTSAVVLFSSDMDTETEIEGTLDTCYTEGPAITFGVNAKYVVDALNKDQRYIWYIDDKVSPMVIASYEDPNQFAVIGPMRL